MLDDKTDPDPGGPKTYGFATLRKISKKFLTSGVGWRRPRVAAMPVETPMMPRALPRRAVGCADRPPRAPIQHSEDARYAIW